MRNLLFVMLVLSLSSFADSGSGRDGGNGGDWVRKVFLEKGDSILRDYNDNIINSGIDPNLLRASLSIKVIKVVSQKLYDNTGSLVDAISVPGQIILNSESWRYIFEHGENISGIHLKVLVLHELLRASKYNDDNYLKSKNCISPYDRFSPVCESMAKYDEVCSAEKEAYKANIDPFAGQYLKACLHGFMDQCTTQLEKHTEYTER